MIFNIIYDYEMKEFTEDEKFLIDESIFTDVTFYDYTEFHEYHKKFADKVYRFIVKKQNKILGTCFFGIKNNVIKVPYSAPFTLPSFRNKFNIEDIMSFIESIKIIALRLNTEAIIFTLPPSIYAKELINVLNSCFFSQSFSVKYVDFNNYFDLQDYTDMEDYLCKSVHTVRQNYKKALKNNLKFEEVFEENFESAYKVIKINREDLGYPLKISIEQMKDIINMNSAVVRVFAVKYQDRYIASAIIFDVNKDISQVIYWGDIPKYRELRPMAMLSANVFDFYKKLGKKILDIGPSGEEGKINMGTAKFKRSIGCLVDSKITFEYKF